MMIPRYDVIIASLWAFLLFTGEFVSYTFYCMYILWVSRLLFNFSSNVTDMNSKCAIIAKTVGVPDNLKESFIFKYHSRILGEQCKQLTSKVSGAVSVKVQGDANVEVIYIADGSDDIFIEGIIGSVEVAAENISVTVSNANINSVLVSGSSKLVVDPASTVESVNVLAANSEVFVEGNVNRVTVTAENTAVTGNGIVKKVEANEGANGSKIETPNTELTVSEGVLGVTAGGKTAVEGGSTVINNDTGTGIIDAEASTPGPSTPYIPPVTNDPQLVEAINTFITNYSYKDLQKKLLELNNTTFNSLEELNQREIIELFCMYSPVGGYTHISEITDVLKTAISRYFRFLSDMNNATGKTDIISAFNRVTNEVWENEFTEVQIHMLLNDKPAETGYTSLTDIIDVVDDKYWLVMQVNEIINGSYENMGYRLYYLIKALIRFDNSYFNELDECDQRIIASIFIYYNPIVIDQDNGFQMMRAIGDEPGFIDFKGVTVALEDAITKYHNFFDSLSNATETDEVIAAFADLFNNDEEQMAQLTELLAQVILDERPDDGYKTVSDLEIAFEKHYFISLANTEQDAYLLYTTLSDFYRYFPDYYPQLTGLEEYCERAENIQYEIVLIFIASRGEEGNFNRVTDIDTAVGDAMAKYVELLEKVNSDSITDATGMKVALDEIGPFLGITGYNYERTAQAVLDIRGENEGSSFDSFDDILAHIVREISIDKYPKENYAVNQNLDLTGLVVRLYNYRYSSSDDGNIVTWTDVPLSEFVNYGIITNIDTGHLLEDLGDICIVITHEDSGETTQLYIKVSEREVTGIRVKKNPRLEYVEGQQLDLSSMVVTLTYNDGSAKDVTFNDFAINGVATRPVHGTHLTKADSMIRVYSKWTVGYVYVYDLDVIALSVESMEIKASPDQTEYFKGQVMDLAGLVVTLEYNDGTVEDIALADFEANGITTSLASGAVLNTTDKVVTITHVDSNKSIDLPITVKEIVVDSIILKKNPKLTYIEGQQLDLSSLVVTLTYSDGSTKDVKFEDFVVNGITTSMENGTELTISDRDKKTITVTCNEKTAVTRELEVT